MSIFLVVGEHNVVKEGPRRGGTLPLNYFVLTRPRRGQSFTTTWWSAELTLTNLTFRQTWVEVSI